MTNGPRRDASPHGPASPTDEKDGREARRTSFAAFLGTAIEWYDFNIYGAAAALVFAPQFFPNFSPAAATLAAFGTFAVAFVARPVGAVIFGHYGDRVGRKQVLVTSLLLMGIGTLLIGLMPPYSAIGIAAPILLVTLRFIQGVGVGGEWGGGVLMSMEHAPAHRHARYASIPQLGLPTGSITANVVFLTFIVTLGTEQFAAWGWRIPFLFSALLVVIALFVRLRLSESPDFASSRDAGDVRRVPLVDVFRNAKTAVLLGAGVALMPSILGYLFTVYLLSYGTTEIGLSQQTTLLAIIIGTALMLVIGTVCTLVSDRIGPLRIYLVGAGLTVVVPFVVFWLLDARTVSSGLAAMLLMGVIVGLTGPMQAILVARAFPVSIRYSGASLAYQVGALVGGGVLPLVAASILSATGESSLIAAYVAVVAVISAAAAVRLRRHTVVQAPDQDPAPVAAPRG